LDYTIIHPGGLLDVPGGTQQVELDIDDNFFYSGNRTTSISREDVAELCISALNVGQGRKVSFDCIANDLPQGTTLESSEDTFSKFLEECKTANYSKI
jgi:hypothetical protein